MATHYFIFLTLISFIVVAASRVHPSFAVPFLQITSTIRRCCVVRSGGVVLYDQEVLAKPFYISHGNMLRTCQVHAIKTLRERGTYNRLVGPANNHSMMLVILAPGLRQVDDNSKHDEHRTSALRVSSVNMTFL